MITPIVLVILGALCRIIPHPPNAVALGAVALFAGAKMPRRWAWTVPIGAMLVADLWLDWGQADRPLFSVSRLAIYGSYAAISLLGALLRKPTGATLALSTGGLSLLASGLFFIVTNFAEWTAGPLQLYPRTLDGLVACYVAAIPFFGNTVAADLTGCLVLFGLDYALVRRASLAGQPSKASTQVMADAIH